MLKQRIITALILAPLFLLAVIYGQNYGFAALILVITGAALFEWLRINQLSTALATSNAIVLTLLTAYLMRLIPVFDGMNWPLGFTPMGIMTLWFSLVWFPALWWMRCHRWGYAQKGLQIMVKSMLGVAGIILFALSMYQLHQQSNGVQLILSLVFLIWVADIGAYISGKSFGKHKLAVNISPGKTWEGVIGAQIAVLLFALIMTQLMSLAWYKLLPIMLAVAMFSVVGDLVASLGKRQAKMKDSSHLLPGHGGVLDRFDSMVAAAPAYVILLSLL